MRIRWVAMGLLTLAGCAHAPTVAPSDPELAALYFYKLSNTTRDAKEKERSDFQLATSLRRAELPFSAFIYTTSLVQAGPTHSFHFQAVQSLSELQRQLTDDFLVPSTFNNYPAFFDAWRTGLPAEVQANIAYTRARIAYRKGKLEEAAALFSAVPASSSRFAEAQPQLAMTLSDERFPHRDDAARADDLDKALAIMEARHDFLQLARISFELGRGAQALTWYRQEPLFSTEWTRTLFDSLPLARPAMACLFVRSGGSSSDFEARYLPVAKTIDAYTVLEAMDNRPALMAFVKDPKNTDLPLIASTWLRADQRIKDTLHLEAQVQAERRDIPKREKWKGEALPRELLEYLRLDHETLKKIVAQIVDGALRRAFEAINDFDAQVQRVERGEATCP